MVFPITAEDSYEDEPVIGELTEVKTPIRHQEYSSARGWHYRKLEEHGKVRIHVENEASGYKKFDIKSPMFSGTVEGIADTGAQMIVGGENVMEDLKLKEKDLFPVSLKVKVADNRKTEVIGGAFVGIKAADVQNKETTTKELIYFVKGVKGLFLSKSCCRKLGIIAKNFP